MTVREALRSAEELLLGAGVPDARLDAEYLLAGVLDAPRLLVCLSGDTVLSEGRLELFFSQVMRRGRREPLQYILGTQPFMGFEFRVTPDVLIPRNDTETLCEQATLCAPEGGTALDLCTGSGALAVALKRLRPDLTVTATDLSPAALAVARQNADALDAAVDFREGDLFDPVWDERFDLILSNPPYIPSGELPGLQEEVRREPDMALDGGPDGLCFYRRIAEEAPGHLKSCGALLLEIGCDQGEAVRALLGEGFRDIQIYRDLNGLERVVKAVLKD